MADELSSTEDMQQQLPTETQAQEESSEQQTEFEQLAELLKSDKWPQAVHPSQICDEADEQAKTERAEGILGIVVSQSLEGKKFLDFGTGQGHVTHTAAKEGASFSVGYDIIKPEASLFTWEEEEEKILLTTELSKVNEHGPYDIILLYDVLDHIQDNRQVEVLQQVKQLLAAGGRIYVRCHPWCGRHGGHYYQQINKAFVNVIFTKEELKQLGYTAKEYVHRVRYPLYNYNKWFDKAKLKYSKPLVLPSSVESFFKKTSVIKKRIIRIYTDSGKNPKNTKWPDFPLSQAFVDCILRL